MKKTNLKKHLAAENTCLIPNKRDTQDRTIVIVTIAMTKIKEKKQIKEKNYKTLINKIIIIIINWCVYKVDSYPSTA